MCLFGCVEEEERRMSSTSGKHGKGGEEYDIRSLLEEAERRWLKPAEVVSILHNHHHFHVTHTPPHRPCAGSLFLFNKRVTRFFRKDGHNWRKKRDGRSVGEAHERLKVANVEALNCYYAHGEDNPSFQRRSYWMLDPANDHIVLVHYRHVTQGPQSSPISTSASTNHHPASISTLIHPYHNSPSPPSIEIASHSPLPNTQLGTPLISNSSALDVTQIFKRLEEQLSLNEDSIKDIDPLLTLQGVTSEAQLFGSQQETNLSHTQEHVFDGDDAYHQPHSHGYISVSEESLSWNDVFESCKTTPVFELQEKPKSEEEHSSWPVFDENITNNYASMLLSQEVGKFEIPGYSIDSDYYATLNNQGQLGMHGEAGSNLTIGEEQKFSIREVSPSWGYASECTRVLIVGSFLCKPSESTWKCMFGDTEVPIQIIQEGVIQCEAPPYNPGRVTLCITSGNRISCSEVREFEYCEKLNSCARCSMSEKEATNKSTEELLLLLRFVQIIDSYSKADDSWGRVIEALLVGSQNSSATVDWILQQLVKDKLQQWLFSRSGSSLSKKDQGIIHMVAGLGFEWALSPILSHGVAVDFRDIRGWTALHWAARFGREKMVASLLASGASAGAVTDPTTQDPNGKTPASIAALSGHKGLAGYLSEKALTSHLTSLTLEESEISKGSAEVEAVTTVSSLSEDQLSLKDTLAAVRNARQAAARIQSTFRAHSFRKRLQKEAAASVCSLDEYGISKLAFHNSRENNLAALSIQKKYRGWKGRKDFLALRQKVVKIQAHVRGYQVRKHYKAICWAVGILDKVVLRWRRKGVGLRGFRSEAEPIADSEDEEDILKVFRKQKVDRAIDEAVSRVLSMVDSPGARQQYQRMLQRYRQAKAELGDASGSRVTTSMATENDYMFEFWGN